MTQQTGKLTSQLACNARSNLEPQQNRTDQSFDILRDSSRGAVWGWYQLSFLARGRGARNIQHISYTANMFWTLSEPVKIHSFPDLEAGLHPGLFENVWKNMSAGRRGKSNINVLLSVMLFDCHKEKLQHTAFGIQKRKRL